MTLRTLPVLDVSVAGPPATAREALIPDDARLGEYRLESRALPRFHVWTLG